MHSYISAGGALEVGYKDWMRQKPIYRGGSIRMPKLIAVSFFHPDETRRHLPSCRLRLRIGKDARKPLRKEFGFQMLQYVLAKIIYGLLSLHGKAAERGQTPVCIPSFQFDSEPKSSQHNSALIPRAHSKHTHDSFIQLHSIYHSHLDDLTLR